MLSNPDTSINWTPENGSMVLSLEEFHCMSCTYFSRQAGVEVLTYTTTVRHVVTYCVALYDELYEHVAMHKGKYYAI